MKQNRLNLIIEKISQFESMEKNLVGEEWMKEVLKIREQNRKEVGGRVSKQPVILELHKFKAQLPKRRQEINQSIQNRITNLKENSAYKRAIIEQAFQTIYSYTQQSKQQIKGLNKQTQEIEKQFESESRMHESIKLIYSLQLNQEQEQKSFLVENAQSCCQTYQQMILILQEAIEQREQRIAKVHQFIKNIKKPPIPINSKQPLLKKPYIIPSSMRPEIEFIPENKQLLLNVWSFQGQIVQFILFFDPDSKKFGLKNPSQTFQSKDLNAVASFNFHKKFSELYEELCLIVKRYIDDVDHLLIYKGNNQ